MLGRQISRKVTRNIGYQVGRLGWSLGTAPAPDAGISGISSAWGSYAYAYAFTASGDYVSTPDSVENSVTGNISLVNKAILNDWTPVSANTLQNKDSTIAAGRSYGVTVQPSGVLRLTFSTDGTNVVNVDSTVAPAFTDAVGYWTCVERDSGTGDVRFYTGVDGINWTQLGATVTAAAGAIYNSTTPLQFGNLTSASMVLDGKMLVAQVWSGFAVSAPGSAVKKAEFNALDWNSADNWISSTTEEIWWTRANSRILKYPTIAINFTSSVAGISRIEYGTVPGVYPWVINESTVTTNHSITLGTTGGLDDKRAYYCRIGVSVDGGATWVYTSDTQLLPPAPVAIISPDKLTIPSYYTENNTYFPVTSAAAGFTGVTTYEGYIGHSVAFCGWDSTGAIIEYLWDFGAGTETDVGGRYFRGRNAGHIFEQPGIYTVALKTTDAWGRQSTTTKTVTIHASGAGNTSIYGGYALTTFYVDSVLGDDTYNGKAQTFDGTNGPWKSFDKVLAAMRKNHLSAPSTWTIKAGDQVLFKRNQSFTWSKTQAFGHGGVSAGIYLGAYGGGAKPKIVPDATGVPAWAPNTLYAVGDRYITPSANGSYFMTVLSGYTSGATYNDGNYTASTCFKFAAGGQFLTITDLEFDFYSPDFAYINIITAAGQIRNIALARCTVLDASNAPINIDRDSVSTVDLYREPYGVFVMGCHFDHARTYQKSSVCCMYGSPGSLVLVDNTIDNGGNHLVYLMRITNSVISGNVFSRPAFGRTALRIGGGISGFIGKRLHVTRNKFLGWIDPVSAASGAHNGGGNSYHYTMLNLSPNDAFNLYISDVDFDHNICTNYDHALTIANARRTRVFDNVFATRSKKGRALLVGENKSQTQHTANEDIDVFNNTYVNLGSTGLVDAPIIYFESYTLGTIGKNIRMRNNLAISVVGRDDHFLGFQRAEQVANVASDNNLYQTAGADFAKVVSTALTKAGWTSTYNQDVNTIVGSAGVVTTPVPTAYHSPGFPDSMAACVAEADAFIAALKLTAGSAAINAGSDLVYRYDDFDGNPAPIGAHQDIGAFEKQP